MFTSDAIEHFGTSAAVAAALDISRQAVGQWGDLVPPLSAARLALASDGALIFDPNLYGDWNNRKATEPPDAPHQTR